jgi:NTE family protein
MENIYGFTGSGGGAKGAWGAGIAHYLVNDMNRDYKYLSGTSTGALQSLLVALNETERLKKGYTNVTNDSIYKLSPYRIKKTKNGVNKTKMNFLKIGWNMLIKKQKTFGDSSRLRTDLLPIFFTADDFNRLKELDKEIVVCVTNFTLGQGEYKSSLDYEYEDFLDWVWASTCAVPFMSLVTKDNYEYADGGFIEHVPIQELINRGCTHIDVISHRQPSLDIELMRNPLHVITRLIDIFLDELAKKNIELAKLKATNKDVIINIYEPTKKLMNNELIFDKDEMLKLWEEGYCFAKQDICKSYILRPGKKIKKINTF